MRLWDKKRLINRLRDNYFQVKFVFNFVNLRQTDKNLIKINKIFINSLLCLRPNPRCVLRRRSCTKRWYNDLVIVPSARTKSNAERDKRVFHYAKGEESFIAFRSFLIKLMSMCCVCLAFVWSTLKTLPFLIPQITQFKIQICFFFG